MNRRQAREEAFRLLFQLQMNDQALPIDEETNTYIHSVITGVTEHQETIDKLIQAQLKNWSLERIALVDKTILRIAVYEIKYREDIPHAVSINEAVELSHKYGDEKSSKFINGILSNVLS